MTLLNLPSDLTFRDASLCLKQLQASLAASGAGAADALQVDAAGLQNFDSSALAVLLACRRTAVATQRPFVVKNMPAALQQLAQLYGVKDLLQGAVAQ